MRALEVMVDITIGSLAATVGAGGILLAAETLPPEISSWANLGGTVILSVLAVWLITKHQPAMHDKYQAHNEATIKAFREEMILIRAAHKAELDELRETLGQDRELDRQSRHEAANQLQDIANKIYLCERARRPPAEGQP